MKNRLLTHFSLLLIFGAMPTARIKAQTFELLVNQVQPGEKPASGLVRGPDGDFYGTAEYGGNAEGVLFKVSAATGAIVPLANFGGYLGQQPIGAVAVDSQGKVYGSTRFGGVPGFGTLWRWSAAGGLQKLADFPGQPGGSSPYGGLALDSQGNVYGTTFAGGANNMGALWRWSDAQGLVKLADFSNLAYGRNPRGQLAVSAAGTVFGACENGGTNGAGTLWQWDGASGLIKLAEFSNTTVGGNPRGGVTLNEQGELLGTARSGGSAFQGTLWKWSTNGGLQKLADFAGIPNGAFPDDNPVLIDPEGNLLGATTGGGLMNRGMLWRYNTNGGLAKLGDFDTVNGTSPLGAIARDDHGALWGTVQQGGAPTSAQGLVWKWTSTNGLAKTADFRGAPEGAYFTHGLVVSAAGAIYGTAVSGGNADRGVLWRWMPGGGYTVLSHFGDSFGSNPGGLAMGSTGQVYGFSAAGGAYSGGLLWKWDQAAGLTKLGDFRSSTVGANPISSIAVDYSDRLYGAGYEGGSAFVGALWRWENAAGLTKLADFTGAASGSYPYGGVAVDSTGNLYGTTRMGGTSSFGTFWRWHTNSSLVKLADFTGLANGMYPLGSVLVTSNGAVFGTASGGGSFAVGTLWRWDAGNGFSKLADFPGAPGPANPYGGLAMDAAGILYGSSYAGGNFDSGTLWQWDSTNGFRVLKHFDPRETARPEAALIAFGPDGHLYGTARHSLWRLFFTRPENWRIAASPLTSGTFAFLVYAPIGLPNLVVEASTNLTHWLPVRTNIVTESWTFSEPLSPNAARFYRVNAR